MPTHSFEYVGLSVGNIEAEIEFYRASLNLHVEHRGMVREVKTAILRSPSGLGIELIQRPGSAPATASDSYEAAAHRGLTHFAVTTDDLEASVSEMVKVGASVVSAPASATRPGF